MSDAHTRDAYLGVVIDLPTGGTVTGRPVKYADALRLMALMDAFLAGGRPGDTAFPLLQQFHELTGISEDALAGLTLGEVVDVINRFFYWRRPAAIAAPQTVTTAAGHDPGA